MVCILARIYDATIIHENFSLQSAPKIIIQILITGTQIFGKALLEAGRQAAKSVSPSGGISRGHYSMANRVCLSFDVDAKHRPQGAIGSDVAGVGNATTGSVTDKLTREHRMTLDEAHLILNTKRGDGMEYILQVTSNFRFF